MKGRMTMAAVSWQWKAGPVESVKFASKSAP